MMKQKFYEIVGKYPIMMGISIEEYAGLQDPTIKEIAMQTAFECRQMFDWV